MDTASRQVEKESNHPQDPIATISSPELLTTRIALWKKLMCRSTTASFEELKAGSISFDAMQNIEVDIERSVYKEGLNLDTFQKYIRPSDITKRKTELRDVLIAYAMHNTSIEYCQGLSYYVAFLLNIFTPEESFNVLCTTIKMNKIEGLFDKQLSLVSKILSVHGRVLNLTLPEGIRKTIQTISNNSHDYAAGWYLTLFSRLSPNIYIDILGLLFVHGFPILFHVASALVEIGHHKYLSDAKTEIDQRMQILFKLAEYPIPPEEFKQILKRNLQMVSPSTISHMLEE
ncbi:hypothetical protein NEOKW01_1910 [Nematocida sp. AWRm80]|nr:hypothetical protein NEOKW01_1910 [Nematocida sp. AWRm80]